MVAVIICAGEALVDLVPHPVPGGGPMNAAIACARLGTPTAFLGRVSTDEFGDQIIEHLEASGVELSLVQRGPEPTCRAEVVGDPPVFRFHGEGTADAAITDADLSVVPAGPHILHGGTLGMFREPGAEFFARVAAEHDGLVSLDPNARPQVVGDDRAGWDGWFERWLAHTDLLRCSDADLEWMRPGESADDVVAEWLAGGVTAVIITTSNGATVTTTAGSASAPSQRVEVADTVGAGDSFVGSLLSDLHERDVRDTATLAAVGLDIWAELLDRAGRVAAVTVSRVGANPPWAHELGR